VKSPTAVSVRRGWRVSAVFAAAALSVSTPAHAGASPEELQRECEYGVALALSGQAARAESVFVSLLSHAPGDPRALTNLGNLHLLRDEPEVALAFYDRALRSDSTDAGIFLNEATALMLLGEEATAEDLAREGVRRAGGPRSAAQLLGLRYEGTQEESPKAAQRAYISREEVLELLRAAAQKVPADSSRAAATRPASQGKKPAPTWRSAGARGAADVEGAALLYWKR